jgi:hypothetical protein
MRFCIKDCFRKNTFNDEFCDLIVTSPIMLTISQHGLVKQFFQKNPNRDIEHPEAMDWLTAKYKKQTGHIFRDPDRAIRKLHQNGFLIKIRKGVYRYNPEDDYICVAKIKKADRNW